MSNENDTEDPDRPPRPARVREPDYEERDRVVRVPITKRPTQEISLEEIASEVKAASRSRVWRYFGGAALGLLFGGGGGAGLHMYADGDTQAEMRQARRELSELEDEVEKLRDKLDTVRLEQARCCP